MLEAQRKAVLKAFKKINALRRELTHSAKMEYLVREYKLKKYVKTRNKTLEEYDPSRVLFESNATLGLRPWTFHDENLYFHSFSPFNYFSGAVPSTATLAAAFFKRRGHATG